jgi:uncharacterized protein
MLQHTFCHLPGIAAKTEQRLWCAGVATWQDALQTTTPTSAIRRLSPEDLRESVCRHAQNDVAWFSGRLPPAQSWRLFNDFRDCCTMHRFLNSHRLPGLIAMSIPFAEKGGVP